MDILNDIKNILENGKDLEESKNYCFEEHICTDGQTKKINLHYKIVSEKTDKIVRLGMCNECGKAFYKNDFESSSI